METRAPYSHATCFVTWAKLLAIHATNKKKKSGYTDQSAKLPLHRDILNQLRRSCASLPVIQLRQFAQMNEEGRGRSTAQLDGSKFHRHAAWGRIPANPWGLWTTVKRFPALHFFKKERLISQATYRHYFISRLLRNTCRILEKPLHMECHLIIWPGNSALGGNESANDLVSQQ